ncbi:Uncharacterised protein [uncultured archaeon]|nr:Uncharacterised protein [uncultured archaeon]
MDLLLSYLKKHGISPDRQQYVKAATMGDEGGREVLDGENEAELPEHLQIKQEHKPRTAGILQGLAGKD